MANTTQDTAEGWSEWAQMYKYFETLTKAHADVSVKRAVQLWLQRLPDAAKPSAGGQPVRVLDVACGSGVATISALETLSRVLPEGTAVEILATDFSDDMLKSLSKQAALQDLAKTYPRLKATVDTKLLDMQDLQGVADGSVDVLIMTFGIMFVPDPVKALREVKRVLSKTGVAMVQTWHINSIWSSLSNAMRDQGVLNKDEGIIPPKILTFGSQLTMQDYLSEMDVRLVSKWSERANAAECSMEFVQCDAVKVPAKILAAWPTVESAMKARFGGLDVAKATEYLLRGEGTDGAEPSDGMMRVFGTSLATYLHV